MLGVFDGNDHIIRNLTIDTAGAENDYLGLFGRVSGSSGFVKNLGVESCTISSGDEAYYLGGLCGYNYHGNIIGCFATGVVSGEERCSDFGGLCGSNWEGEIRDCYANVSVSFGASSEMIAGLCGYNIGVVSNCYAMGSVSGSAEYIGGFCAMNERTIAASFWDKNTSGRSTSSGGEGKTTAQMQTKATFVDAGWDFAFESVNGTNETWVMDDYPVFLWQRLVGDQDSYTLPFNEPFEPVSMSTGTVHEQHGWTGGGIVQTGIVHNGVQALELVGSTASHLFLGNATNVWVTLWLNPTLSEDVPRNIPSDASAVFYVSTNRLLVAYDSTNAMELTSAEVSNGWNKVMLSCDYSSKVWNLELNDSLVVSNFSFYGTSESFSAIELIETSTNTLFIDSITITDHSDDIDSDGLPDKWEEFYYGGLSPSPSDISSNGVDTVYAAYIADINPTDPDARFDLSNTWNTLWWNATSGRVYTIYWSSNLLSDFQALESNVSWTAMPYSDTNHSAEAKGFYKIDVELE